MNRNFMLLGFLGLGAFILTSMTKDTEENENDIEDTILDSIEETISNDEEEETEDLIDDLDLEDDSDMSNEIDSLLDNTNRESEECLCHGKIEEEPDYFI